jgi:hypothetical protein
MTALTRLGFSALPVFDSGFFTADTVVVPASSSYPDEVWRLVTLPVPKTWRRILTSP